MLEKIKNYFNRIHEMGERRKKINSDKELRRSQIVINRIKSITGVHRKRLEDELCRKTNAFFKSGLNKTTILTEVGELGDFFGYSLSNVNGTSKVHSKYIILEYWKIIHIIKKFEANIKRSYGNFL